MRRTSKTLTKDILEEIDLKIQKIYELKPAFSEYTPQKQTPALQKSSLINTLKVSQQIPENLQLSTTNQGETSEQVELNIIKTRVSSNDLQQAMKWKTAYFKKKELSYRKEWTTK
ncbi:hypothetical protein SS50377_21392 [Spironucleus salmonicida]|uniref:Uncharacterized protein n=1 Tax=Spironucleus salmonicida TaxID=348837 RepID=V6LIU2_9EUKA|nr:hypothetical protein SS50377_21392 [Spironucleus salmonicida]|eukprot:EST44238.1 Hypothetical protein SS50377_15962 [Spironucleus salmonicida]